MRHPGPSRWAVLAVTALHWAAVASLVVAALGAALALWVGGD